MRGQARFLWTTAVQTAPVPPRADTASAAVVPHSLPFRPPCSQGGWCPVPAQARGGKIKSHNLCGVLGPGAIHQGHTDPRDTDNSGQTGPQTQLDVCPQWEDALPHLEVNRHGLRREEL